MYNSLIKSIKLIKFKNLVKQQLGFTIGHYYDKSGLILLKDNIEFLCLHYDESGDVDFSDEKSQFYLSEIKRVLDSKRCKVLQEIILVVSHVKDKDKLEMNFKGIKYLEINTFTCVFKFKEGLVSANFIKCLGITDNELILHSKVNMILKDISKRCFNSQFNCYYVTATDEDFMTGLGVNELYLDSWKSDVYVVLGSIKGIMIACCSVGIKTFQACSSEWYNSLDNNEKLDNTIYRYYYKNKEFTKIGEL